MASDPRQLNRALWLLVLVGLAIRIAAIAVLDDYRNPLTAEYGILASNLAAGKGYVGGGWLGPEAPTALNTPVYPLFLAAWLRFGGTLPYLGVELTQAVLSALLIYLVAAIARHLCNPLTSLGAAILMVFYPPLIYFPMQISPAVATTFFSVLSFYLLLRFLGKPTWLGAAGCGFVFGVSVLVEPILLVAMPGATLVAWLRLHKEDSRALVGKLAFVAAICAMMVLLWTARNYRVFGRVVLLKTSFGLNLWMGNNPEATGILYTTTGQPMQDTLPASRRDHLRTLNEAERSAVLEQEALEWIGTHPEQFLRLTLKRVFYLWWLSPTSQVTDQNITEPRFFYAARAAIQALLLVFGLAGGVFAWRRNRTLFFFSAWWLIAFTVPYSVTVAGNSRYRLPVEPVLIVLAAFCIAEMAPGRNRRPNAGERGRV
jgi:4-amino-4-deoxy-L-arabinose transferase-like glycosyltransferase